ALPPRNPEREEGNRRGSRAKRLARLPAFTTANERNDLDTTFEVKLVQPLRCTDGGTVYARETVALRLPNEHEVNEYEYVLDRTFECDGNSARITRRLLAKRVMD